MQLSPSWVLSAGVGDEQAESGTTSLNGASSEFRRVERASHGVVDSGEVSAGDGRGDGQCRTSTADRERAGAAPGGDRPYPDRALQGWLVIRVQVRPLGRIRGPVRRGRRCAESGLAAPACCAQPPAARSPSPSPSSAACSAHWESAGTTTPTRRPAAVRPDRSGVPPGRGSLAHRRPRGGRPPHRPSRRGERAAHAGGGHGRLATGRLDRAEPAPRMRPPSLRRGRSATVLR
jgi:hypothetical protein